MTTPSPRREGRSHTAEIVALARAVGSLDPALPAPNPDVLARRLLDYPARAALWPGLRRLVRSIYERRVPGMYLYHQARTQHLDRLFAEGLESGVRQAVILGAGLDTRFYRFAERLRGVRAFELDHPATAAWKRERLQRAAVGTEHVAYASVDFREGALLERLEGLGFDRSQRTLFLCEGVFYYLPEETNRATMAALSVAAPGSLVAFDYVYRAAIAEPPRFFGMDGYVRYVAGKGEPVLSGLDPQEVSAFVARYGYEVVSNTEASELGRRYLERDGRAVGPMSAFFGIAFLRRT